MRLSDIVSGFAFKTAFWTVLAFVPVLVLAAYLLVINVTQNLKQELRAQMLEEVALYQQIYRDQGQQGLHHALSQINTHLLHSQRLLTLYDEQGRNLLGANYIQVAPDFVGWQEIKLFRAMRDKPADKYLAHHFKKPQASILIGRSLKVVELAQQRLIFASCVFIFSFAFFVLLLGGLLSRRSWSKLAAIEQGLRKVSHGAMETRLPVSQAHDQIDRVAWQINCNLERMQDLVATIKNTSVAISHDLKTPLAHAQISLHAALDALEEKQNPQLEIQAALDETVALNAMFDTILRISRIQTKDKDLSKFSQVDVASLCNKVVDFLSSSLAAQQQKISVALEPNLTLFADAEMLQQALFNLISNSVQHGGTGITIELRGELRESEICICVQDNGVGISRDKITQITRPFIRADSARSSEGNGLGLSLVEAICGYHDAKLCLAALEPGLSICMHFRVS